MLTLSGQSAGQGAALGTLYFYKREKAALSSAPDGTPAEEWARFRAACACAGEQLAALYKQSLDALGEEAASIFSIHRMILDDIVYLDAVRTLLETEKISAACAASQAGEQLAAAFAAMDDEYMRGRADDVRDVSRRVADVLSGAERKTVSIEEPVIIAAEDLSPSEMIGLDPSSLLGFVLTRGSGSSHVAILARTLALPAVFGIPVEENWHGRRAALDGENGTLYIDPTADICAATEARRAALRERHDKLEQLRGLPSITRGGRAMALYANVSSLADVETALQNDAEGVGLFRSEMLYMNPDFPPTEERQFAVYRDTVQRMAGRPVVIRTLDIGADKRSPFVPLEPEENPALGMRGVRVSLAQPALLCTQLRALLRASAYGPLSILIPMVIRVEEVRAVREQLAACRRDLTGQGVPVGDPAVGVMIETPAAVWIAEELAQEAEFFSIGTNDLTQYALALDRMNPQVGHLCDPYHPAIVRMVEAAVQAGHHYGRKVCVCGELGADEHMTETFVRIGVDALSVTPPAVLPLRGRVRELE